MHIVYLHCPEEVEKDIDGISVTEKGIYTADKYLIERLRYSGHNVDLVEFSENFVSDIKKSILNSFSMALIHLMVLKLMIEY